MTKRFLFLILLMPFTGSAQIITTVAGNGVGGGVITYTGGIMGGFVGDGGPATVAELNNPMFLAFDSHGNLFISDLQNNVIRKVDTEGIISTYAGNGDSAGTSIIYPYLYSGDGGPATNAELCWPWGIAIDGSDNLFIADVGNDVIRKVSPAGIISTYAGHYRPYGYVGYYNEVEGSPATTYDLMGVGGLGVDTSGNLYILDDEGSFVRKVSTSGRITTVAGSSTGQYSGEGGHAINAQIGECTDVKIDNSGNIYLVDNYINDTRILKINSKGIINSIAGNGTWGDAGDNGPAVEAQFRTLSGIAVDNSGSLFITDASRVRKIDAKGIISTIAGHAGTFEDNGDGGSAIAAQLNVSWGLSFDKNGNLFIADQDGNRVRMITNVGPKNNNSQNNNSLNQITSNILNPNNGTFNLSGYLNSTAYENILVEVINRNGLVVYKRNIVAQNGQINMQVNLDNDIPDGIYLLYLSSGNQKGVNRFMIEKQ